MLQAAGANTVKKPRNPISAVKPSRGSGQTRAKNRRGGENVRWKRLTASFDDALRELARVPPDQIDAAVRLMAGNQRLATPITRLVFFKHLTVTQGIAARRYAGIIRQFERFHVDGARRSAKAQNPEPIRPGEDQEIQRHIFNGTMDEYEADAKRARKEYDRAKKVLDRYADGITGRNEAKNILDDLCLSDIEPPSQYRANIAAVCDALAKEFGVKERR
jgi:hypothetical protein